MKFTIKKLMAGTLTLGLLALSGCSATPDSKEDPLSQFGVDAQLPFATKEVTETPTPLPTASATPIVAPTNTLSWQDEVLEDPGIIEEEEPQATQKPTATPKPEATKKPEATQKPAAATPKPTEKPEYIDLKKGDSGDYVTRLQKRLKALGYLSGSVDGKYGDQTVKAVRRFQQELGWEHTGVASVSLQKKLFAQDAPAYDPPKATAQPTAKPTAKPTTKPEATQKPESGYTKLEPGDTGSAVKKLQKRLKELGYFDGEIGGNYLDKTTNAVKRFQKAIGVDADGIATASLQEKIFADDAPKYEAPKATAQPTAKPTAKPEATKQPDSGYQTLQKGDTGSAVKKLQKRLKELGYFNGEIGGNYLDKTVNAVKRFQKTIGVEADGVATASLQEKIFANDAPKYQAPAATAQPEATQKPQSEYQKLQPGDSGNAVKKLQKRLKELGYFEGNVAGNYKDLTTQAVKDFQTAIGVEADGIATAALQERLFADDAPAKEASVSYTELKYGDTGAEVKNLQKRLKELGYFEGDIGGNYLEKTQNAVELFQSAAGLKIDGVASSSLQELLFSKDAPSGDAVG